MKIKTKRNLLSVLLSILCAVLLCCSVGMISGIKNKSASAAAPTASDTVIQLTLDSTNLAPTAQSGKMFDGNGLAKLYDAILGSAYTNTGTYNKVKAALKHQQWTSVAPNSQTTTVADALTAADIRENGGKNIHVKLGKTAFEVVYVTLDNSGDLIVDLWQSESTQVSPYTANSSGSPGYSVGTGRNDNPTTRPGNVYGRSYIRAKMLGQGGDWDQISGQNSSSTPVSGESKNALGVYAALWNSCTTGDLSKFIDTPSQILYQEIQSYTMFQKNTVNGNSNAWFAYTCPGDAYGIPFDEWYHDGSIHYSYSGYNSGHGGNGTNLITGQDQWKNDKIWLPSVTETGHDGVTSSSSQYVDGIWCLDNSQRDNNGGSSTSLSGWNASNSNLTWLRSGKNYVSYGADYLTTDGEMNNADTSNSLAVRPALHLNLKKAQASAATGTGSDAADFTAVNTPTDIEFTYDGIEYTDMAAIIARVEAGKQKTPADASGDINSKKEIKWFDEVYNKLTSTAIAGTAANSLYDADAAIEYKIEYKQVGKTAYTTQTAFSVKNAGEYKITCSFETTSGTVYKWRDINTGAVDTDATKEFKITVKQLEVKYKWKSSGGKLNESDTDPAKQWKATFDKDTFTPASGNSAAPWVYLDYTLLTTTNSADNANGALLTYDQTNKKSQLGASDNDTLPCVVVKYNNTEQYDNVLDNIYVNKNGTTRPVNGTSRAYPEEAGHYTVTATDINKDTSNYKLVHDTSEPALTATRSYEIKPKEINAPLKPNNPLEYSGSEQSYSVPNYDEDYMEYGTWDGTTFTKDATPTDMTAGTTGADAPLTVKATKVNDYKVSFRLVETTVENTTAHPDPLVRNYKWKSADTTINGTTDVWTVNYAIQPKTLEFDFHSSVTNSSGSETFTIKMNDTTGELTYSFKTNKGPVNSEVPVLELYFAKSDNIGASSINPNTTDPAKFIYKDLVDASNNHVAGKYIVYAQLASSSANPVNKNYRLKDPDAIAAEMTADGASQSDIDAAVNAAKATYEKEITLTAGEATLNDLPIVYKEGDNITNSDAPIDLSFDYTNKKNLQYKLGSDGKTPVVYWIYFDLDGDFSFLEVVGAISYQYDSPATDTTACTYDPYAAMGGTTTGSFPMRYAGMLTITVKIKVKDSEKANNKLPAQADYDALTDNVFTYTAGTPDSDGNVYDGTLVFTYEIRKAEVDSTKIADTTLLQWKYSTEDDTKWKDYTTTSFPEYSEIAQVDFRVNPTKYNTNGDGTLSGVKGASLDSITNAAGSPEKQGPGQRFVTIAYTVDENNYEKVNYDNTTLTGKYKYTVEISPKVIDSCKLNLTTWKEADGVTDKTNSLGVPYQIWELDLDDPSFANFIDYEYYLYDGGMNTVGALIGTGDTALLDLTNPSGPYAYLGIDGGNAAYIYVKPVINQAKVDKVNGEPKYALKDLSGTTDKDSAGVDGYKKFEFGKQMTVIKVELVNGDSVYGDSFTAADIIKMTTGGVTSPESTYNTAVYKDKVDNANLIGDMAAFCANSASLDAGKYIIKVTAVNDAMFVAVPATVNFEITPKPIELPTLGEIVFNGSGQSLAAFLGGSWNPAEMTLGGDFEDIRDVSSSGYSATITLKNSNYCWAYPSATPSPTVKVLTKYSATDVEITPVNASVAEYKWNISPLVVDTTNMWSKGSKGATLNLPNSVKDLIAGGTLELGYRYYDSEGNYVETPQIKGNNQFKVEAVFGGDDSVRNVQFKTGDASLGNTSPAINYTVPQSGAAAFFGKALSFLKSHWWWFLIALAILIFLIVLIIVIAHRRKTKEAREEKKAQKEEDRRRREEEREAERRRREQELELQKAKQEAELAKMKAELGIGAGVAGVAMAAQQPAQQPVQQPQLVQQPQYSSNDLAEIKAQLAEIRAQQRMNNGYQQMPMMQMPMMQQMPMQGYGPQMAGGGMGGGAMSEAEMRARIAEDRLFRSAEQRAIVAEERLRGGAPQYQPALSAPAQAQLPAPEEDGKFSAEQLGVIMATMMKNMNSGKSVEERTVIETETAATSVDAPTVYPPDAVITTTTTVDTTKSKAADAPRSDDGRLFDVDGFYDTFENNK